MAETKCHNAGQYSRDVVVGQFASCLRRAGVAHRGDTRTQPNTYQHLTTGTWGNGLPSAQCRRGLVHPPGSVRGHVDGPLRLGVKVSPKPARRVVLALPRGSGGLWSGLRRALGGAFGAARRSHTHPSLRNLKLLWSRSGPAGESLLAGLGSCGHLDFPLHVPSCCVGPQRPLIFTETKLD